MYTLSYSRECHFQSSCYITALVFPGITGFNCDPHTVAIDYRYVGFRECAAEVARYLVAVEGMDLQDPLRMRLLSHLQCYSSQRESASKASLQPPPTPSWPPVPHSMHHVPPPVQHTFTSQYGAMGVQATGEMMNHTSTLISPFMPDARHLESVGSGGLGGFGSAGGLNHHHHLARAAAGSTVGTMMGVTSSNGGGGQGPMSPSFLHSLTPFHGSQFPAGHQGIPMHPHSHPGYSNTPSGQGMSMLPSSGVKPYRPWGGELAY